jgi:putative ABC transport system permease protein
MDPRVEYVDEIEPMTDTQLGRVRGVDGVEWAVPFFKGLTVAHAPDGLLQQVILLGVDDATLTGVAPRLVLGSVESLTQPDALIIDRAGFRHMWPGRAPALGKVIELNDHRAVIVAISEASPPFTTFPVVYTKYSSAMNYIGRTRKQMSSFILVRARPGKDSPVLAHRIAAETGLRALTWRDFAWATISYYLRRTGIPVNFGITVALGFIVGAAVVGQTFYNLRDREPPPVRRAQGHGGRQWHDPAHGAAPSHGRSRHRLCDRHRAVRGLLRNYLARFNRSAGL